MTMILICIFNLVMVFITPSLQTLSAAAGWFVALLAYIQIRQIESDDHEH